MSTEEEKLQAIRHAVSLAEKEVEKLTILKEVSYLNRVDQLRLEMAIDTVKRGKALLKASVKNEL